MCTLRDIIGSSDLKEDIERSLHVSQQSTTPYSDATQTRKQRANHIKRPMNPFMVWSQLERRKIISRFPDSHNAEISKSLGRTWRGLTPEERRPFLEEADRLKMLHSREFPHYKYQPRKKPKVMKVLGAKETLKIQAVKKPILGLKTSKPGSKKPRKEGEGQRRPVNEPRQTEGSAELKEEQPLPEMEIKQEQEHKGRWVLEQGDFSLEEEVTLDTLTELSLASLDKEEELDCLQCMDSESWEIQPVEFGHQSPHYPHLTFDYDDIFQDIC